MVSPGFGKLDSTTYVAVSPKRPLGHRTGNDGQQFVFMGDLGQLEDDIIYSSSLEKVGDPNMDQLITLACFWEARPVYPDIFLLHLVVFFYCK